MHSIQLQLHATPADFREIIKLLAGALAEVHFYAWGPELPFSEICFDENSAAESIDRSVQVVVSLRSVHAGSEGISRVLDKNPGVLVMMVPHIRDGKLQEIDISARTDGEDGLDQIVAWAKFIRKLRKRLISGAYVTNPRSGAKQYYKNAHATRGAISAAEHGLILTAPGGNIFEFTHTGTPEPPGK